MAYAIAHSPPSLAALAFAPCGRTTLLRAARLQVIDFPNVNPIGERSVCANLADKGKVVTKDAVKPRHGLVIVIVIVAFIVGGVVIPTDTA